MCVYKCVELTDLNLSVKIHAFAECAAALKCVKCWGKNKSLLFMQMIFFFYFSICKKIKSVVLHKRSLYCKIL